MMSDRECLQDAWGRLFRPGFLKGGARRWACFAMGVRGFRPGVRAAAESARRHARAGSESPIEGGAKPPKPAWAARHPPSVALFFGAILCVLAVDLASKSLAFERLGPWPVRLDRHESDDPEAIPPHRSVEVIPGVLHLRLTTNTGAVFGIGKGGQSFFVAVSIVAVVAVVWMFWTGPPGAWGYHLGLGLLLGGALGNLYDRVRYDAVRDLLWLFPGTGIWPWIFNVADAALMVGVGLVLVETWRHERPGRAPRKSPD